MPKSAPFMLKAPENTTYTSKHAHKSSSRVVISEQPVKASSLHPGFQSLLGQTSPVKKSGNRQSHKKGPETARYHPYQQTFNKNEQREVTNSYGAQWNFFEGPEAGKEGSKEDEKAPIVADLKESETAEHQEQEVTVKEEAEVKEEPDSEPE